MACNTIQSFTYDRCEANLGGIRKIWLSNYVEDAAAYDGEGSGATHMITGFTSGATWVEYPMRKNTASMVSTLNVGDEGGVFVTTALNMVFSKMDTPKRLAMVALAVGECMAVVEDANGLRWFLGKDYPLTATEGAGETGTAKADPNHYTVTLTDESKEYPIQVSADVNLA